MTTSPLPLSAPTHSVEAIRAFHETVLGGCAYADIAPTSAEIMIGQMLKHFDIAVERAELAERDADSRLFDLSAKARDCAAAEARAEQAEAALKEAREALKPFATMAASVSPQIGDRSSIIAAGIAPLKRGTVGDLRRAAAVLEKETGG